jgi:hypothetical protein
MVAGGSLPRIQLAWSLRGPAIHPRRWQPRVIDPIRADEAQPDAIQPLTGLCSGSSVNPG